jgi:hypothetical protein
MCGSTSSLSQHLRAKQQKLWMHPYMYTVISAHVCSCLGPCTLSRFFLGCNQLVGTLPSTFGALSKLQRLELNGNRLKGQLPMAWRGMEVHNMLVSFRHLMSEII